MAVGALTAIVLFGAGFMALGFALIEKILRPLREMRDGLERIGRGELSATDSTSAPATSFNRSPKR
jgi:nitrate/nitrite-specific signal transduction histidine kinase